MNYHIIFEDRPEKKKGKQRAGLNLTYFDETYKDTSSYLPPNVPKHSNSLSIELMCPNINITSNFTQAPPVFVSPTAQISKWYDKKGRTYYNTHVKMSS